MLLCGFIGVSGILAPLILALILIVVAGLFVGRQSGGKTIHQGAMMMFVGLMVLVAAGALVMTNWFAFIDPPEFCWRGSGRFSTTAQRRVPWEECRLIVTLVAIGLNILLVSGIAFHVRKRRS